MKLSILESVGETVSGLKKVVGTKLRYNRPEIGLVVGIGLLAAGTAYACTKTKDAVDAIETAKEKKEQADAAYVDGVAAVEQDENESDVEGRLKELKRERNRAYFALGKECAISMCKIYAKPAGLWVSGLVSVVAAHCDLKEQNTKLIGDTVLLKKVLDEYRGRWREKVGEEEESKVFFDCCEGDIEVEEEDPKTGNRKVVKKKGKILRENGGSKFARNFSKRTSYEFDARSYSDYFVELKIADLNKKLRCVPFITMNEVYDALGMKPEYGRCADGLDWGWVYNPLDPDGPNEIVITRLEGWEEVWNDHTDSVEYYPCMRIDFNPQPLRGRI